MVCRSKIGSICSPLRDLMSPVCSENQPYGEKGSSLSLSSACQFPMWREICLYEPVLKCSKYRRLTHSVRLGCGPAKSQREVWHPSREPLPKQKGPSRRAAFTTEEPAEARQVGNRGGGGARMEHLCPGLRASATPARLGGGSGGTRSPWSENSMSYRHQLLEVCNLSCCRFIQNSKTCFFCWALLPAMSVGLQKVV